LGWLQFSFLFKRGLDKKDKQKSPNAPVIPNGCDMPQVCAAEMKGKKWVMA
jgi:hypothetical protein